MATRAKLTLNELKFISLVDNPAQQTAKVLLVKRDKGDEVTITAQARVMKVGTGDNPLIYCWAFTCTDETGQPYHDLQGDAIEPDFIKAAEAFMANGGASDEMHDEHKTGHIAFAFPMDADIAKAFFGDVAGGLIKTSGLMVAVRASKDALEKVRFGEYTGVSIAGTGTREPVDKGKVKCAACKTYQPADATTCKQCGHKVAVTAAKADWTTAYKDSLPDSAFLYIEGGGDKDKDGKTTPRDLRHFPFKDASGNVDIAHLRDATGRIPQSSLPADVKEKLQMKAEKLLGAQHDASKAAGYGTPMPTRRKRRPKAGGVVPNQQSGSVTCSTKRVVKRAVLTSVTDGHQHTLDLDDPADSWSDSLSTSYQTADGATEGHCHAWVYDDKGAITIALDSGHTHTVSDVVPPDVLAEVAADDDDDEPQRCCGGCGMMCDMTDAFCPRCGMKCTGDAVPTPIEDEPSSGKTVVIVARAPDLNSPPSEGTPTVTSEPKEHPPMSVDEHLKRIADLQAANERLAKVCTLTDSQRAHFNTLNTTDGDVYLSKSMRERDFIVDEIKKSDQVVYTSKSDGRVYRKSDDIDKINMAMQIDKLTEDNVATKAAERAATFAKRGDEILKNFPIGTKKNLRGRMMKALNAEFTDAAEYEEAETALKALDNAMGLLGTPIGVTGAGDDASPITKAQTAFENGVRKYAEQNNLTYAEALERGTASDPAIRQLYNNLANVASN